MNLKIKNTTGLVLEGNKISGNTYPVKDYIKSYLGGKWNGDMKAWTVDVEKVNSMIAAAGSYISVDKNEVAAPKVNRVDNGWCNKCQSWCYGDCQA